MPVEVANESGAEVDEIELVRLADHVLAALSVNRLAELSVLLVDVDTMTGLHVQYMDEPGPTDVLAFPMDELQGARQSPHRGEEDDEPVPPTLLGDVVLCPQVAADQARAAGHATDDELHLLATHGILHLLGYDHGSAEEEQQMFALQRQLLDGWQAVRGAGGGQS